MRRPPAVSVRAFALTTVICMLGGAAGCGRETWDLLTVDGAAGAISGAAGAGGGGAAGLGGGGFTSVGGSSAGSGGRTGFAGAAGRPGYPSEGGSSGTGPCSSTSPCTDNYGCMPSVPFCTACSTPKDCSGDAQYCDPTVGRCYQCRQKEDCAAGEACFAGRCGTPCKEPNDCDGEITNRICNPGIRVCVACIYDTDCTFLNNGSTTSDEDKCYQGSCVQCWNDRDCTSKSCVAGRCQKH